MKIAILGGGPAGLYAATLMKRLRPSADVDVFEQNARGATFGFGVVFSAEALAFLRADDGETADLIEPHMRRWSDIVLNHRGERIVIDGVGFSAIGRLELITLLASRAAALGAVLHHERRVTDLGDIAEADLVIGADGINSVVRGADPGAFGASLTHLDNRFVWYGAARDFDALTQTFIDTPHGPMNAHHYAYATDRSTFIIEMRPDTFARTGFEAMDEPAVRAECEALFAGVLEGAPLIANNATWRRFPNLSCARFFHGNRVLVGDALHTAHFSIGSGTRLALEDVTALARALEAHDFDIAAALPAFQSAREPVLLKIVAAANRSAHWYEAFDRHMALDPWPFALSYIRRAGRLDGARLRRMAPDFSRGLEARGIALEDAA